MTATVRFSQPAEKISTRLSKLLTPKSAERTHQESVELAFRSGSMQALAAVVVHRFETNARPVRIAVARPLSIQPAVFAALASEIHYLVSTPIEFVLEPRPILTKMFSRPVCVFKQIGHVSCWSMPSAIKARLPYFASLVESGAANLQSATRVVFANFPSDDELATDEVPATDIVLWSTTEPSTEHKSFANSVSVRMMAL